MDMIVGSVIRLYVDDGVNSAGPAQFDVTNPTDWHHYVFTANKSQASGIKLYIDAVQQTCSGHCGYDLTTVGNINDANSLGICSRHPDNPGTYMAGIIDDVRIYTRVLSAQDISDL